MVLTFLELVLRAHLGVTERLWFGQLDAVARPEHEQLEERRSRTPGGLYTYTNDMNILLCARTRDLTTHLLGHRDPRGGA